MPTAAELLHEALWDPELHPHAPAGSPAGGQFTTSGGGAKSKASKGQPVRPTGKTGPAPPAPKAPPGPMAYDPARGTGPGYGSPHGDQRVHQLQQALNRLGVFDARGRRLVDDGRLGPLTTQAVKKAQRRLGQQPTGQVTPQFLALLVGLKALPKATDRRAGRVRASVTAAELLFGPSPALRALETRYVRTPAGSARYGLPIGSPIGAGTKAVGKAAKAAASAATDRPHSHESILAHAGTLSDADLERLHHAIAEMHHARQAKAAAAAQPAVDVRPGAPKSRGPGRAETASALHALADEIAPNHDASEPRFGAKESTVDILRRMAADVEEGRLTPAEAQAMLGSLTIRHNRSETGATIARAGVALAGGSEVARGDALRAASPSAPKPSAPGAGKTGLAHPPAEAARRIKVMGSADEARQYLANASRADLTAVADAAGISYGKGWSKKKIEGTLVHHAVIRRLSSDAISRPASHEERIVAAYGAPKMSTRPLARNTWGGLPQPGGIHFHNDGEIGSAIKRMGEDAHLEVEGDALANVLGHVATDAVQGRITAEQQVERLKEIRAQLPATSRARRELDTAIEKLTAPDAGSGAPKLPDAAPQPLHQLATELHAVPLVRRDPRVMTALQQIAGDFAAGRTGGGRLLLDVRRLFGHYHESQEGSFEVRRAVQKAMAELEAMRAANPKSLYPPEGSR